MLKQPGGKLFRFAAALIVAAGITGSMLYGMNKFAQKFKERDPTRYFRVSDIILPDPSRPAKRPPEAQLPPSRSTPAYSGPGVNPRVDIDHPRLDVAPPVPGPDVKPDIPARASDGNAGG